MSKGDIAGVVALTVIGLLLLLGLIALGFENDDCSSRGGVMVRSLPNGYVCVKALP